MKKWVFVFIFITMALEPKAQSAEAQQLLLNWEKLTQLKQILQSMYDGYKIIYTGYTTIKDISEGNFSLHKTFLDGLFQVSPAVRSYKRIADIVSYQVSIVKNYKAAFKEFKESGWFNAQEIDHLGKVYSNLLSSSLKCLDELTMVITAGQLRMSDDERLQAIDRIYANIADQFAFLEEFNNSTNLLAFQRKTEQAEIDHSKKIRGF